MLNFNLLTAVNHLSSFNELAPLYQSFSSRLGFLMHSLFTNRATLTVCEQLRSPNEFRCFWLRAQKLFTTKFGLGELG